MNSNVQRSGRVPPLEYGGGGGGLELSFFASSFDFSSHIFD